MSYGILYIFLIISIAVYAVDLFTCVNLLFFDKWSGQVKPAIPFEISRWIFTACIILSYILLAFRWWRAVRAMQSGVVAASYLDPLAVRVQSIRIGARGRGWRRFLVFAALTKGRKGAEYVALFTYFSFEGMTKISGNEILMLILAAWLRICFAEGPRQVINALTLYSVMQADLVPTGQHAAKKGSSPIGQFFINLQMLADKNKEQAAILFGMLFTLIIWIFSALSLMMAAVFYITFLWHHIRDGSLSKYCRRKIDTRLHKIVMIRVNRALEKDTKMRGKSGHKGRDAGTAPVGAKRQPTVPVLKGAEFQDTKPLSRQASQNDTPPSNCHNPTQLTSHSADVLAREPTVPVLSSARPKLPSRSTTQSSAQSYNSQGDEAPLVGSAAPLGYATPFTKEAPLSTAPGYRQEGYRPSNQNPSRLPHNPQRSHDPPRPTVALPGQYHDQRGRPPFDYPPLQPPPTRKPIPQNAPFSGIPPGQPGTNRRRPTQEFEMQPQPSDMRMNRPPPRNDGYVAFKPNSQARGGAPFAGPPPQRNFTQPPRAPPMNYFGSNPGLPQRSGTAPIPPTTFSNEDVYDAYGGSWAEPQARAIPRRLATAGPQGWAGPPRTLPPYR